jgi:hypothetical protein
MRDWLPVIAAAFVVAVALVVLPARVVSVAAERPVIAAPICPARLP